ncbi:MAG: hypothetical protein ACJ8M4_09275 [Chthoniobacterales bacterium]
MAVVATYSFSHGMILWALALPLPSDWEKKPGWIRRWILWLFVYALIGAIAVGCYFIGYKRPEVAPSPGTSPRLLLIAEFIIVWLGAVLKSDAIDAHVAGGLLSVVLFASCSMSALFVWRKRSVWRNYYPWFLLAGFAIGVGAVTAAGRAHLGLEALVYDSPEGFGSYRYKITSVLAYIAAIGLVYRLYRDWVMHLPIWQPRVLIAITVLITLLGIAVLFILPAQPHRLNAFLDNRRRAKTAVIWSEALPRNPELFHAYPYTDQFPDLVAEMRGVGLIQTPPITAPLREAISHPPLPADARVGSIEGSVGNDRDVVRVLGWALIPNRNVRADYVVLGWQGEDDSFHPFTAMPTGRSRPDVTGKVPSTVRKAGFLQEINISELPRSPFRIGAWSIDLASQKAFPIDGAVPVDARAKP